MSLSVALYLTDIFGSLNFVTGLSAVLVGIVLLISFALAVAMFFMEEKDKDVTQVESAKKLTKTTGIIFSVLLLLNVLAPSTNTMYLIAANNAAQSVVKSPQGQELINKVMSYLDSQLKVPSKADK